MAARARHLLTAFALATLAVTALLTVLYPVYADDHWWHMLTGRYLLEHGAVPHTDPFSFTCQGQRWVNWEWLSGLAMIVAYDGLGGLGLVALRFVAVLATLVLLWRQSSSDGKASAPPTPALLLTVIGLALLVMFGRASDRPHLYALPLLAATSLLSARALQRRSAQPMVLLLGVMTLWVVIHPSWMLGVLVHATTMIDGWRAEPQSRTARGRRGEQLLYRASPLLLLMPAAALHAPGDYGAAVTRLLGTSGLVEWRALSHYLHWTNVPLVACLVLMALWLLSLVARPKQLTELSTWLLLALLVGSWLFVRFTPLFAVLVAPRLCREAARRWPWSQRRLRTEGLLTVLVAACLLLVVLEAKAVFRHSFSTAVDPRANPVWVTDFMSRHGLGGNVLANRLNAHGYVALQRYPHVRVFIDGRVPQLFDEGFLRAYEEACASPQRFTELLARFDVHHVVLMEMFSLATSRLTATLQARGDFELVAMDEHTMLWSRRSVLEGQAARPAAYRFVIPPLIDDSWFAQALAPDVFPAVHAELARLLREQPGSTLGQTLVATLLRHPAATKAQRAELRKLLGPH